MPYDLYVITDEALAFGLSHKQIAQRALAGGADVIQLRDKTLTGAGLVRAGRDIANLTRKAGRLFIMNDRLDAAVACGADGVHFGQGDMPVRTARQLAPPGFVIGVSVGSVDEARAAGDDGADYVALSPVFATGSKADAGPGHGLVRLRQVRDAVRIPVIAIGGITTGNVRDVIHAGADGVAVISAVVSAPDIEKAARDLRQRIRAAKREAGR